MTGTIPPSSLGWFFSWAWIDFFFNVCVRTQLFGPMNSSCIGLTTQLISSVQGISQAGLAIQFAGPSVK